MKLYGTKKECFPEFGRKKIDHSHETILWCNKGGKKREYYFDYEYSKVAIFLMMV